VHFYRLDAGLRYELGYKIQTSHGAAVYFQAGDTGTWLTSWGLTPLNPGTGVAEELQNLDMPIVPASTPTLADLGGVLPIEFDTQGMSTDAWSFLNFSVPVSAMSANTGDTGGRVWHIRGGLDNNHLDAGADAGGNGTSGGGIMFALGNPTASPLITTIRGTVKSDYDPALPVGTRVELYRGITQIETTPVGVDGRYEFTVASPGADYSVQVSVANHVDAVSAGFNLVYGQQKTVDLLLEKKWYVTTLAGSGAAGCTEGDAASARFQHPSYITYLNGYIYVPNSAHNAVQRIDINTGYTTILIQDSGVSGPNAIVADGADNLYVTSGNSIVKIDIGNPLSAATFVTGLNTPHGLAVAGGYLYIANRNAHNIMRKALASAPGTASIFAGGWGTDINPPQFISPSSVAVEGGFLYVADYDNHVIRKITIATGEGTILAGTVGSAAYVDGIGAAAKFDRPWEVVPDGMGNLYVSCYNPYVIRKIEIATGKVTTITKEGPDAYFAWVFGMCIVNGDIYAVDHAQYKIKKLTRDWP
jgi:hypothetical protein